MPMGAASRAALELLRAQRFIDDAAPRGLVFYELR
jgi:hypothetical protein